MSKWPPRPAPVKTKRQSQHRRRTFPNPHSFLTVIPTVIVTRYFEIHSVLFVNTVNFVNIPCSKHIIDLLCQNTPVISNQSPSLFEMFPLHPKIFIRRSLNFSKGECITDPPVREKLNISTNIASREANSTDFRPLAV